MSTRSPVVTGTLVALLCCATAGAAAGQDVSFRVLLSSATASLAAGDTAGYLEQIKEGEASLSEGHINRPFAQYHVARGYAMVGDSTASVAALRRMLD